MTIEEIKNNKELAAQRLRELICSLSKDEVIELINSVDFLSKKIKNSL